GGNDFIDGGAGFDTVGYFNSPSAVTVNLATGTASGGDGNDSLTSIEGISGSPFTDILTGDANNNSINGRGGNDTIDGGAGSDTINFANSPSGVTVNLALGTSSGGDGNDIFTNIENIRGSPFADTLTGDANNNFIEGGGGNDIIDGGAGFDTASYFNAPFGVTVNLALASSSGGD